MRRDVSTDAALPRAIVLDFEGITHVDLTGADALQRMHDSLQTRGVRLALARVEASVEKSLDRGGALTAVGVDTVFATVRAAVADIAVDPAVPPRPAYDAGRR